MKIYLAEATREFDGQGHEGFATELDELFPCFGFGMRDEVFSLFAAMHF